MAACVSETRSPVMQQRPVIKEPHQERREEEIKQPRLCPSFPVVQQENTMNELKYWIKKSAYYYERDKMLQNPRVSSTGICESHRCLTSHSSDSAKYFE